MKQQIELLQRAKEEGGMGAGWIAQYSNFLRVFAALPEDTVQSPASV